MLLSRSPFIYCCELDGEVCLFHPDTAQYLNLNSTGSAIWNLLVEPMDRKQLFAQLLDRYEVEPTDCRRDTEVFLAEAIVRGMLLEQPASP
jgi:hypothetical protein